MVERVKRGLENVTTISALLCIIRVFIKSIQKAYECVGAGNDVICVGIEPDSITLALLVVALMPLPVLLVGSYRKRSAGLLKQHSMYLVASLAALTCYPSALTDIESGIGLASWGIIFFLFAALAKIFFSLGRR